MDTNIEFRNKLLQLNKQNKIEIFYRAISYEEIKYIYKIDLKESEINNFSDKLFYFGNKPKHFWNNNILKNRNRFDINSTSPDIFDFIHTEYNKLKDSTNDKTKEFVETNKNIFDQIFNLSKEDFIKKHLELDKKKIIINRNYHFIILHRIGNYSRYKKKSHFTSSSTDLKIVREKFHQENGIIITYWNPFIKDNITNKIIFFFKNIIYKEQKEFSSFMGIYPHYILSFEYKGKLYYNKYIQNSLDYEYNIFFGLDIEQSKFVEKLKQETNYQSGSSTNNHIDFKEIK